MTGATISFKQISKAISKFLHRYHVLLFVLIVIGGLSIATLALNQAINAPSTEQPDTGPKGFDTETMKNIQGLKKSTEQSTQFVLPAGRTNPFI